MSHSQSTTSYVTEENQLEIIFEEYLSECLYVRRLSFHTIVGYREVFKTFQKIVPEADSIESLKPHVLVEFFRRLGTRTRYEGSVIKVGVKDSTTRTYYNKLMAFFRWLEVNRYLSDGYITKKMKRPPAPKYVDKRSLEKSDIAKIISAIIAHTVDDEFLRTRDMVIISALLYLGVRRSELLGLRIHDIDFKRRQVLINSETSKSVDDRYVPLHPVLERYVLELLQLRKDRGYTSPYLIISTKYDRALSLHGLRHWVKKYKELSKVRFHLHRFRHTFTCELAHKGADMRTIMLLLGHTTSRMTETYLRSLKTENSQQYVDLLNF